jgi:TrmH family RNA methyltransferase
MAISKNEIKFVQALHQKKYRQIYEKFIVEGEKISRETLMQRNFKVSALYAVRSWLEDNRTLYSHLPTETVKTVSQDELDRISALHTPNEVLLVVDNNRPHEDYPLRIFQKTIFLDDMQDPGNLGALLRIADWFGVTKLICSPTSVEVFNPKVIQASMGAFLRVSVETATLKALCDANPEVKVLGAILGGENIFRANLPERGILVIGNESKGISEETRKFIDLQLEIPKPPEGGAESLNAAVASGIIMALWVNKNHLSIP